MLWELRQDAAACLGILCTVLSYEAERIFKWLFVKFNSSSRDEVKLLYLVAAQRALEAAGERKAFSHIMQVKTWMLFTSTTLISAQFILTCLCISTTQLFTVTASGYRHPGPVSLHLYYY